MEHQKVINLLDYTPHQPCKFRTGNWVEINDDSRGNYNINNQIRFRASMWRSILSNYSDAYILVNETVTITGGPKDATDANKQLLIKRINQ